MNTELELHVTEARYSVLSRDEQRVAALTDVHSVVQTVCTRPARQLSVSVLDKLRFAVSALEDGLWLKAAGLAGEAVQILDHGGGTSVGDRGTFALMALQQRLRKMSA
ncbi:MAG: hypothetical protein ACOYOJ_08255 [Alsobacter sp.]